MDIPRKEIKVIVEWTEKPTQEMLNRVYEGFYEGRRAKKANSLSRETPHQHSDTSQPVQP